MSQQLKLFRQDIREVFKKYSQIDPTIRRMDALALLCILLAGINYLIFQLASLASSPANVAQIIFPIFVSGIIFAYRQKMQDKTAEEGLQSKSFFQYVILFVVCWLAPTVFFIVA